MLPVHAYCSKVEYRRRTAHDVECHPRVTEGVAQLPHPVVYLQTTVYSYQTVNVPYAPCIVTPLEHSSNIVMFMTIYCMLVCVVGWVGSTCPKY